MLQTIREKAQGWIAWFIVILISIPFALWGINSYLGGGSDPVMASVDGVEITERDFERRYREFRQQLRERMGANYRPELLDEKELREQVLDAMIRDEVIRQASDSLGLAAGDALVRQTILSINAFQIDGRFNQQVYENALRSRGMSPAGFEAQVRRQLITGQLSAAISGSEIATDTEVDEFIRLRQQNREFQFARIPAERFKTEITLTDDEVRAHYDSHQTDYVAPERVRVEYLDLDVSNIAETLSADEPTLQGYYEQNKDQYLTREQRRASHILIAVEEGAGDDAVTAAREKAGAALDRVRGGEEFAEVAKELSEDPGSADLGGDLDFFEKGIMDPAFEETVFEMNEGDISDLVQSAFGFHIIKLTGIRPAAGKSFEEAREDVESAYLKSEASRLFYEYAERLSDLVYEDPNSLEPAAETLSLKIQKSDWFSRDGGSGVFEAPKVVSTAFSEDVRVGRHNSEAIELGPEHIVVLRVIEHEEQSIKPFEQVADEIRDQLVLARATQKAKEGGGALIEALRSGGDFAALAEQGGYELEAVRRIGRNERGVPQELVKQLFTLSRPSGEQPVFGDVELADGDVAVVALLSVEDGKSTDSESLGGADLLKSVLRRSTGQSYYQHLIEELRQNAKVVIFKKDTEG